MTHTLLLSCSKKPKQSICRNNLCSKTKKNKYTLCAVKATKPINLWFEQTIDK